MFIFQSIHVWNINLQKGCKFTNDKETLNTYTLVSYRAWGKVRRLIEKGKRTGRKRTRGKVRRLIEKRKDEPGEREPGERSED